MQELQQRGEMHAKFVLIFAQILQQLRVVQHLGIIMKWVLINFKEFIEPFLHWFLIEGFRYKIHEHCSSNKYFLNYLVVFKREDLRISSQCYSEQQCWCCVLKSLQARQLISQTSSADSDTQWSVSSTNQCSAVFSASLILLFTLTLITELHFTFVF